MSRNILTYKWLAIILIPVVGTLLAGTARFYEGRLDTVEAKVEQQDQKNSAQDSTLATIQSDIAWIKRSQERTESALQRLLERNGREQR